MMVGSNIIGSNPIASSQEMFQSSFRLLVKRLKFWKKQTIKMDSDDYDDEYVFQLFEGQKLN